MVADLVPGAHAPLPDDTVSVRLTGPFDLSALVLGPDGLVGGDADFVFYNAPSAPGVQLSPGRITVTPGRLRAAAVRVVVVVSPEESGRTLAALRLPAGTLHGRSGAPFARLTPPRLAGENALLLTEVYQRGGGWRVRAVGQGYADGLAGLARDFGVDVAADTPAAPAPARPGGAPGGTPGGAPGGTPGGTPGGGRLAPGGRAAAVLAATNAERARLGLGLLTADARLGLAAQAHTEDMVRRAFFSHQNPDGAQVWDRALAAGYRYRKVAENIAAGQRDPGEVVLGWMASPGHRANILDAELTQIGVGYAVGGRYGTCWTQVFGTPR